MDLLNVFKNLDSVIDSLFFGIVGLAVVVGLVFLFRQINLWFQGIHMVVRHLKELQAQQTHIILKKPVDGVFPWECGNCGSFNFNDIAKCFSCRHERE